jgi:hypothetical protein
MQLGDIHRDPPRLVVDKNFAADPATRSSSKYFCRLWWPTTSRRIVPPSQTAGSAKRGSPSCPVTDILEGRFGVEQYERLTGGGVVFLESQGVNPMEMAKELWALGAVIVIFLIALAYGGWRSGWLSRQEKARTHGTTLEGQGGQQGGQRAGWQGGAHTRPDDITRGV